MLRLLLILLPVLLIVVVILRLTATPRRRRNDEADGPDDGRMVSEILEIVHRPEESGVLVDLRQQRSPVLQDVLLELMDRMGAEAETARRELERMGFPVRPASDGPLEASRPNLSVYRSQEDLEDVLERAFLVGVQIARTDDDYARVGDDYLHPEALLRQAEDAETTLFGDGRRHRYTFYGKAGLALQDMLQGRPEDERQRVIVHLLDAFDRALESLQSEMSRCMAGVPQTESLQWGDSRDRRFYYFKMGVINTLRHAGIVESLGHLYRLQGVNYDVEDAYRLAAQECPPLVLADSVGIDRLIGMGPAEVRGLVRGALPKGRN